MQGEAQVTFSLRRTGHLRDDGTRARAVELYIEIGPFCFELLVAI